MDTLTMRQHDGLPTETALPDGTVYRTDAAGLLIGVDPRHQTDLEAAGYTVVSTVAPTEPAPIPESPTEPA